MIYSISEVQLEEIPGGTFWWCSASWSPGGCRDPHSTTVFTHPHPPLFIIACVSSSSSSSSTTSKKYPSETTQCYLKPSFCQFAISQSRAGSAQAANSNRAFMFMCRPSQLASFLHQRFELKLPLTQRQKNGRLLSGALVCKFSLSPLRFCHCIYCWFHPKSRNTNFLKLCRLFFWWGW